MASGKRDAIRGRDCLLNRDYSKDPLTYQVRVRGQRPVSGEVKSEDGLYRAIERILDEYRTDDLAVALRRLGKGVCPKSFPVLDISNYLLDMYAQTHGGDYGTDLMHLPVTGGILDQPNIFLHAFSVVRAVRSRHIGNKLDKSNNETKNTIHRATSAGGRGRGEARPQAGSFGRNETE